ncbi:glycosyltransferase family 4 protein [Cohnella sp. AR92]|uniref:glycosyltransferase family 4 protein n=1 Tax=Cohnella sp. AR92 TaxID=648716 RepID=UPI000F8E4690|nr:glycosyltransferase family 4 protein [Cohnella sp. AR92]RUS45263.1 glycosyltransferase family 1 protein [Cohnella sp. AR92]
MRIAWIGPMPNDGGGATGVGRSILLELSRKGIEVDCYFSGDRRNIPEVLLKEKNLNYFCEATSWSWNRWYSRNNYMAFVTGQYANLRCEMKLAKIMAEQHRIKPYDLVFQFSHIELHALKKYKKQLPPIVLYPTVHHAAELRWHRREKHLAKGSESWATRMLVRLMLNVRASTQKRHVKSVDYIVSLSRNFAKELCEDYKLSPDKVNFFVPNPIDVDKFRPMPELRQNRTDNRVTFLFVSRISVRKGTEMMVELSRRLSDLAGQAKIILVGNHSLWSDYRGLLKGLNPEVATYISEISGKQLQGLYHEVDSLVIPSHYEPFGLVVGEALASGLPVVASDKIGAAEEVKERVCRIFAAGDMDALEAAVRKLYEEIRSGRGSELSEVARHEAVRLFSREKVGDDMAEIFERLVHKKQSVSAGRGAVYGVSN